MNDVDDATRFLAILEVATRTRPADDGRLSPEALLAISLIAGLEGEEPEHE